MAESPMANKFLVCKISPIPLGRNTYFLPSKDRALTEKWFSSNECFYFSDMFGSIRPKLASRLSVDSTNSVISMTSMTSVATDFSPLSKAQSISSIQKSRMYTSICFFPFSTQTGTNTPYEIVILAKCFLKSYWIRFIYALFALSL